MTLRPLTLALVFLAAAAVLLPVPLHAQSASIEALKNRADTGDREAEYRLGEAYLAGSGVPLLPDRAAYWLQKAALQCSGPAMDALGQLYLKGSGVSQDSATASQFFRLSAAQGTAAGLFDWGDALYENRAFLSDAAGDTNVAPGCAVLDTTQDQVVLKSSIADTLFSSDPALSKPVGLRYIRRAAALGEPRAKAMLASLARRR
jgi:TPR repeat protein